MYAVAVRNDGGWRTRRKKGGVMKARVRPMNRRWKEKIGQGMKGITIDVQLNGEESTGRNAHYKRTYTVVVVEHSTGCRVEEKESERQKERRQDEKKSTAPTDAIPSQLHTVPSLPLPSPSTTAATCSTWRRPATTWTSAACSTALCPPRPRPCPPLRSGCKWRPGAPPLC